MEQKTAVIIGAGPAGLTAAYEFVSRSNIRPIVFEADGIVGGIARTVSHNGNRMDIGGHRFFSKSDRVMNWWFSVLPVQQMDDQISDAVRAALGPSLPVPPASRLGPDPAMSDRVMLVRNRLSRILFRRRFFDYPLSLSARTMRNLGALTLLRIGFSYAYTRVLPRKEEKSLEDFFINRFGRELYRTFFKAYTEKVWGVPCSQIQKNKVTGSGRKPSPDGGKPAPD